MLLVAACGPSDGAFSALTYNVAGLPEGLSKSNPERNHITISPKLNDFDLVLVQEDFAYHERLIVSVEHEHRSTPKEPEERIVADGLNRFSRFALGPLERQRWDACNGTLDASSDCLSEKGFSVSSVELADGVVIEVFNFHMDAGGREADDDARKVQIAQMLAEVEARSGRAMILGGDTNLRSTDELDVPRLAEITGAGFDCACEVLACGDERIDRFFFRSSDDVVLEPTSWRVPEGFVDADGEPLSDHLPVAADFTWRVAP